LSVTRKVTATTDRSTITGGSDIFGFGYHNASRRTSMSYPNGAVTSYGYDNLSRLTSLAATVGAIPITSFGYTYDDAGNRTQKTTLDHTEDYAYDALYRLEEVKRSGAGATRWLYGYDEVGNRTGHQVGESQVMSATYDQRNRLQSRDIGGQLRVRGALDEPGTVTVDGTPARMLEGNLFEAEVPAVPGVNTFSIQATDASGNPTTQDYQVTVTGSAASYSYDPNGNLTQKTENGHVWDYVWNAENQLIRVCKDLVPPQTCDSDGMAIASFSYDPLGRRISKRVSGVETTYTYDWEDILREMGSGGAQLKYVHGPSVDEPLGTVDGSGVPAYLHADALGSITKRTDGNGAVIDERRYGPWGDLELGGGEAGYAFTGREWTPEVGLYYYRARFYDASSGRFISEDPLQLRDRPLPELNGYSYVANDPVNRVDPLGLESTCGADCSGNYAACRARVLILMNVTARAACNAACVASGPFAFKCSISCMAVISGTTVALLAFCDAEYRDCLRNARN
jgi:RHS repeat-associated protein